jgi:hypothetical protein
MTASWPSHPLQLAETRIAEEWDNQIPDGRRDISVDPVTAGPRSGSALHPLPTSPISDKPRARQSAMRWDAPTAGMVQACRGARPRFPFFFPSPMTHDLRSEASHPDGKPA